ncbi:MAG: 50S ribosomal protein L15, partial [Candidatus Acidiferrales bacterium]
YSRRRGFEGGQMPLHRRMPKRGFANPFSKDLSIVNVETLNAFEGGTVIGPEELALEGLVHARRKGIKILGDGDLKVALTVKAHAFSKSAQEKITAAGGTTEILS